MVESIRTEVASDVLSYRTEDVRVRRRFWTIGVV
jgi:hypothetical protein